MRDLSTAIAETTSHLIRHANLLYPALLSPSLPLDRARRLAGDVIHHAVDALDLVDDAGRDVADELHVEGIEVRRHAVGRHRQDHREGLPDVVVEAGTADFLDEDVIGEPQNVELLARDLARHADR